MSKRERKGGRKGRKARKREGRGEGGGRRAIKFFLTSTSEGWLRSSIKNEERGREGGGEGRERG